MSLFATIRVALKALGRNKLRTGLTMLGMIIGVSAVITMVALGRGAQEEIETQIRGAGTNLIRVRAGNFRRGGVSMGVGGAPTLTVEDVEAIREAVPGAQFLAAGVSTRDQVISANRNWNTQIEGTDVELPLIRVWNIDRGAFFNASHVRSAAKVAVLGSVVRDNLFGEGADPVGERIRIRNQSFQVIGVMAAKGAGGFGQDQDDTIFTPYTTVQKKTARPRRHQYLGNNDLGGFPRQHQLRRRRNLGRPAGAARPAAGRTGRLHGAYADRRHDNALTDDSDDDRPAGRYRRRVADRRRHRHHEHHARLGHGTNA